VVQFQWKPTHQFFYVPNVVGNSRFHGWCDAQCLVNPAEVVIVAYRIKEQAVEVLHIFHGAQNRP